MTTDRDETATTMTGLAPGLIRVLVRAATVAAEHGHNWIGEEDLLYALLNGEGDTNPVGRSVLETRWRMEGIGAMTYDELLAFVATLVPGPGRGTAGPGSPASVAYSVEGPNAEELTGIIER